jgi:hypothetical protein
MSNQYIKQVNNQNFVYPNFELAEYDINIIHNINNNSVSGTTSSFNLLTAASTGITIAYNATWLLNGAEPYVSVPYNGTLAWSIHAMAAGQNYFKSWRLIQRFQVTNGSTSYSVTGGTFAMTPAQLGLTTFVSGNYYFEFRFIGANVIYPVCQTLNITIP